MSLPVLTAAFQAVSLVEWWNRAIRQLVLFFPLAVNLFPLLGAKTGLIFIVEDVSTHPLNGWMFSSL